MQKTCIHVTPEYLAPTAYNKLIYKDECTKCFSTDKDVNGIDICLKCFNGGCCTELAHSQLHAMKCTHPLVLNYRSILKNPDVTKEPAVITKVAVGKPGGIDQAEEYEIHTKVLCYACNVELDKTNPLICPLVDSIIAAHSAIETSKIEEWEHEYKPCQHVLKLVQVPAEGFKPLDPSKIHCEQCDLSTNLWFCLTCGNLGCGRQGYGGTGGRNHGVDHHKKTGHPVVVKMGTITPEGKASLYCYVCDDDVIDPNLSAHMATFGIDVKKQVKTEKTMAELELALNLAFSLSQQYEQGLKFTPLYGPFLTGIENIGNTCYISSVLQLLFSFPEFVSRYYETYIKHMTECTRFPPDCFYCQMAKVAYGLCSGVYSQPQKQKKIVYEGQTEEEKQKDYFYQQGISPRMFKTYIGKGHPDYSSGQQQDASLYFTYLLDKIQKQEKIAGQRDPTEIFRFNLESKLKCTTCGGAKYSKQEHPFLKLPLVIPSEKVDENTVVDIRACIDNFMKEDMVDLYCPKCAKNTKFAKSQKFATFPKVLVLAMQREVIEGMMLKKLPVHFDVPLENFNLETFKALPRSPDEVIIEGVEEAEPDINAGLLNELLLSGVPELAAKHALVKTGNVSSELAISWYFEHMSDPSLTQPLPKIKKVEKSGFSEENVAKLLDFGFSREQAIFGLSHTDDNFERAIEYICSHPMEAVEEPKKPMEGIKSANYKLHGMITHLGANATSGHYIAHVKRGGKWVYYNDLKVGAVENPAISLGTIYFFVEQ